MLLDKLKRLFEQPQQQDDRSCALQMAAAVLLVEVSYSDYDMAAHELDEAAARLAECYGLEPAEADRLIAEAAAAHGEVTSLHDYLRLLNTQLQQRDKEQLLEALWSVAFSDARLDPQEEHRIRRIAEWLYLPHSSFVRTKLKVSEARAQDTPCRSFPPARE